MYCYGWMLDSPSIAEKSVICHFQVSDINVLGTTALESTKVSWWTYLI